MEQISQIPGTFQSTHWSVIRDSLQSQNESLAREALNELCRAYWPPLYVFLRHSGYQDADAKDLTQDFLANLLRRDGLTSVQPDKGRFRSFLIASLKNHLSHHRERRHAQKRGAGAQHLSLDDADLESFLECETADGTAPERMFDRRWAFTVLDQVRARLAGEYTAAGKRSQYDYLVAFLPGGQSDLSQTEIASALGLTVSAVKSEVYRLRQRFGQYLRMEVAQTVADPGEIDAEIRHLIGVLS